ncbi:MAG: sialidase [Candidatus Eremiobacteraeota bacterium]|nr:sialidase [Candidatus Eremiobacteraeota bacterium]
MSAGIVVRAFFVCALAAACAATREPAKAATFDSGAVSGLGVRNVGSAEMSGRIAAIAGRREKDGKVTLFVGAASGGVWKSSDGGTTFDPVFDKEPVQSIGAIALDPTHPDTVWVGTGESWTRNSVSIGDGIYKSTDGGQNWAHAGLPNSERIARIVVSPKDGNVVYACVPGKLWSDSADRGLYRTTDGGAHWSLVLHGENLSTGCSSVTMDPTHSNVLFAGLWDFRRKGWTFRSGGDGPDARSGSALYRSNDGGTTWSRLTPATNAGLPKGPWGRVEVAIAPSNAKMVYAFIENKRSALFVSSDAGRTWEERDRSQRMVWRPFYFARIVGDPTNDQRLFKMNLRMIASDDGGRSFADSSGGSHGDWHDIWIDPTDSKYIVGGDDGGLWLSYDGGTKWWKGGNLPISQFYHVSVDDKDPYQVYGGLQDNSSWVGDSAYPGGITNQRWENLGGGDGFWAFPDPTDPNFSYTESQGGSIGRVDRRTLETRDIQPKAGYGEKLRWNWNAPMALSPNERGTIYIGAQFLFRSRDRGNTWDRISPDLTTNDPEEQKQEQSGGITVDNSFAETHTTIYSISESPKNGKVIWVGTDDGNVQLTQDGGATWNNVTSAIGAPKGSWVSWVEASRYDPATAYVTIDRHTFGDMGTYLYRTTDFGKTWTALVSPQTAGVRGFAHVVREDTVSANLLFLGTEFGLWVSVDGGKSWAAFKPDNFPAVPVRDLAIAQRDGDLVIASHGRGIWIVDDLTPLRNLSSRTLDSDVAFLPDRPVQQRIEANGGWVNGDAVYVGDNPSDGAVITYYLRTRSVIGKLGVDILDSSGKVVDSISPGKRKGLNRITWTMRTKPPLVPPAAQIAGASTQGPRFLPGSYTVRLTKAGKVYTMPLSVGLDRRATFTLADRRVQFEQANRVAALFARMSALVGHIAALRSQAGGIAAKLPAADPLRAQVAGVADRAEALRKLVVATSEGGAITGEQRLREDADEIYGAIASTEGAPTPYAIARVGVLDRELADVETSFAALTGGLPALDQQLKARALPQLSVAASATNVADQSPEPARGGPVDALFAGMLGSTFRGSLATAASATSDRQ